jgi:hypothetical protein
MTWRRAAAEHLGPGGGAGAVCQRAQRAGHQGYQIAEPPTVRLSKRNRFEFETSWSYSMVGTAGLGNNEARAC